VLFYILPDKITEAGDCFSKINAILYYRVGHEKVAWVCSIA
jgi:hypothetical protein